MKIWSIAIAAIYRSVNFGEIDIAQPDISMAGGFTEMNCIAQTARARSKRLVPHGYKTNIPIPADLGVV
jgi:L-alanine-DL-glutamate epimerase-like enolase superfamily enzyme